MAELDVRTGSVRRGTVTVRVHNLGPEASILTNIEGKDGDNSYFGGEPLKGELELLPHGQPHEFLVAPSLALERPFYVTVTWTDDSGSRTKDYPIYA